MKPDKDLTVTIEDAKMLGDLIGFGMTITDHHWKVYRRIQRAAFEKGAKAQICSDSEFLKDRGFDMIVRVMEEAPLVEFEEENHGKD